MPSLSSVVAAVATACVAFGLYIATQPEELEDKRFDPSWLTKTLFTSPVSSYKHKTYKNAYQGELKVLVVLTENGDLTMQNGNIFSSGNHPVETLVPMLHLKEAGFAFDFATHTGKPGVFEMWAMPQKDNAVNAMYIAELPRINNPLKLADIDSSLEKYAAVFIPGGHGAMNDEPEDANLGALLRSAHNQAIPTITLCHGPAALLSAQVGVPKGEPFIYEGYTTAVFPDAIDSFTPYLGYLPGKMPWLVQMKLEGLGMRTVANPYDLGSTHVDRELITGDSPDAADPLGVLAAEHVLQFVSK